jgi:hypothetical protein
VIHAVFLLSALAIAMTDRLLHHPAPPGAPGAPADH